ncbi:MAG: mannose-1-phosphate guanylyltransferase/mannose-6-phosphate isomerase [Methyloceanibacter sp.]|uniref:mannose-1-phosphate guanylyltransferase/mannose-6-phosphate isomerase n=1 Tax=Methyloceanibacter sp. TaxID=1965321 RepID=UPI003D6CC588
MSSIYPVVLSGGTGSRLWPVSRAQMPKQLMPFLSSRSLLQETVLRLAGDDAIAPPLVISNADHRFMIAAQLHELGVTPTTHVLEPVGRNTAPAAAVAAKIVGDLDPDGILVLLPADHHIADAAGFKQAVLAAAAYAEKGHIVTFGIAPKSPETGYGYIRRGNALDGGVFAVAQFCEKPDLARAKALLAEGGYDWNSGIFMARADVLVAEMQVHCPEILAKSASAVSGSYKDLDFLRLDQPAFQACPSEPFDTAVMERTTKAVVMPLDIGWSDVGSWSALWELGDKDPAGNVIRGDVLAVDTQETYIRGNGRLVTTLGVKDLVIVDTGDAVLVADRSRVQDVRGLVAKLKELGRAEHDTHSRVHRPWGYFESIEAGDRYQVKHLMVKPGASLSLQMHHHRAEHWVVVKGTARVVLGNREMLISENESTYIPIGTPHRLENPGKVPLSIIEVQSGCYLGEDDIVRFDDRYGRLEEKPGP